MPPLPALLGLLLLHFDQASGLLTPVEHTLGVVWPRGFDVLPPQRTSPTSRALLVVAPRL